MSSNSLLTGRVVLLVDWDEDVVDAMVEQLDMCIIHKANDRDSAMQYLLGHTYDFVVLGMEGRDLAELLETCVMRKFPTVLLLPPSVSPEALKRYTNLEALYFHPKEKMSEIGDLLVDILTGLKKPLWRKLLEEVDAEFLSGITAHQKRTMI